MGDPKNDDNVKTAAPPPTNKQPEEATGSQNDIVAPPENAFSEEDQEIIELDNLEDIEFLLDEIEDQIAPLAL